MSGPKVDIARLREQEMKRLVQARQQRRSLVEKINAKIKYISSCSGGTIDGSSPLADVFAKLQQIQTTYTERLNKLLNKVSSGNETLDCESCVEELNKLLQEYELAVAPLMTQIRANKESQKELSRLEEQSALISGFKRVVVHKTTTAPDSIKTAPEEMLSEVTTRLQSAIRDFLAVPGVTSAKKNSAFSIHREMMEISQSQMDAQKKVFRVQRLCEDFDKIQEIAEVEIVQMKQLYENYQLECFDNSVPVKPLSEFTSKQELLDAITAAKKDAECALSKEYIKRQINEVMAKHGYDVVRSDLLAEATESGQVLYGVNDTTAINVFVSNDNQVTMRVVGIGFDESVSAEEDEALFQQQCAFCSLHPQITEELKMRGVILETRKHLPPDKRYNKKIKTKTKVATASSSRAKKELKRSEPKVMHKE